MPIRLIILEQTFQALQATGQALIRQLSNGFLIPAEYKFGGDIGCTYAITKIAYLVNCSLDAAIIYFYSLLVGISSLVAIIGLWCFAKTWAGRLVAVAGVFIIAWVAWLIGDEYILSFTTAACIPLILYFFEKKNNTTICIMVCITGFFVVYANFCRIHTGTLLALVIGLRLLLYKEKIRRKALLSAFFIVGFGLANFSIYGLFSHRNKYLRCCG